MLLNSNVSTWISLAYQSNISLTLNQWHKYDCWNRVWNCKPIHDVIPSPTYQITSYCSIMSDSLSTTLLLLERAPESYHITRYLIWDVNNRTFPLFTWSYIILVNRAGRALSCLYLSNLIVSAKWQQEDFRILFDILNLSLVS